jgi:hypothetical protein
MKIKNYFLTLLILGSMTAVGVRAATINQTIARINADANKPGGPEQVLKSISASTHVPVATLEKEKAKSGMNYGDLYAAHAIGNACGKSFADLSALKAKGQTWDQIADANGVSLGGKKQQKAVAAAAKATPTPPMKTLRQEQAERYNGTYQRTNEPKAPPTKP